MILNKKQLLLHVLRAKSIARRYLITNGFDGSLTMLGMVTGFYVSGMKELSVAISACLGATVALFISGLTSAYLSEKAEREKELHELVNGLAPLLLSLVILLPLLFAEQLCSLPSSPFINSIFVALICIFFLGVFIGKISGKFWLWSGLRTLITAIVTLVIILLFGLSI